MSEAKKYVAVMLATGDVDHIATVSEAASAKLTYSKESLETLMQKPRPRGTTWLLMPLGNEEDLRTDKKFISFAIHKDENSCYGVTIPDVAGCFGAGDTIDEAIEDAKTALVSHLLLSADLGDSTDITPMSVFDLVKNPEYAGAIWVSLDLNELLTNKD